MSEIELQNSVNSLHHLLELLIHKICSEELSETVIDDLQQSALLLKATFLAGSNSELIEQELLKMKYLVS